VKALYQGAGKIVGSTTGAILDATDTIANGAIVNVTDTIANPAKMIDAHAPKVISDDSDRLCVAMGG
jgi:hypothetical protein